MRSLQAFWEALTAKRSVEFLDPKKLGLLLRQPRARG